MTRTPTLRVRLAAAAGAAALLLTGSAVFVASPAMAVPPSIRLDSPDGTTPLTSPVIHVAGEASMPSGGTVNGQLKIDVASLEGRGGGNIAVNVNSNRVPFAWDYATSYNGRYRVTVTATGRDGAFDQSPNEQSVITRDVVVEVKPAPPTGVAVATEPSRAVKVSWNPNGEPDIVGYQVQRQADGSAPDDWTAAGNTAATSFVDNATTTAGGKYHYRVVAVRTSSVPDKGIASDPSETKTASVPNPPPTTTVPGGGNGGDGGGGPGGGNGGGTGGNGTGGGGGNNPDLARTGKVDLSGFSALLQDAQQRPAQPGQPGEDDGTYGATLPFKPGEGGDEELGEDGTALGDGLEEAGAEEQSPLRFVAASLLVTVIVMHLLWLKREVDKAPAREGDAAPAG